MKNNKNKDQKIIVKVFGNEEKENLAPYYIKKKLKKKKIPKKNFKPFQNITSLYVKKDVE